MSTRTEMYGVPGSRTGWVEEIDRWLLLVALLLVAAGLVMVLSASYALASINERSPLYFLERQAVGVGLGLVLMAAIARLDYHKLRNWSFAMAAVALLLMLLVLVPHVGVQSHGARRWFNLGPLGSFQPSELGKLAFSLFIATWISRRGQRLRSFTDGFIPFGILTSVALLLLLLQRDLGSAIVMSAIFVSAYFAGGGRKLYLLLLLGALAGGMAALTMAEPYRMARLEAFQHPFADPLGSGFQSVQALYALGSGGPLGVGLGHSVEKFFWLPEAHTDFIYAIVGEETGLWGTTLLLLGFVAFAVRGYRAAMRAPDSFGLVAAATITTWISFQAVINMATVTDTLPITGVPLPFISYGGTAVTAALAAVGVLLSISRQGDDRSYRSIGGTDATVDIGRGNRRPPVTSSRRRASVSR